MSVVKKAVFITVSGRVQGVGFRFFVLQQARIYKVKGWVKNTFSATVETHAEGEVQNLKRFIQSLKQGPSLARVKDVAYDDVEMENYKTFDIKG